MISIYTWHIDSRRYTSDFHLAITDMCNTVTRRLLSWRRRNRCYVCVARRWQLASRCRLLQIALPARCLSMDHPSYSPDHVSSDLWDAWVAAVLFLWTRMYSETVWRVDSKERLCQILVLHRGLHHMQWCLSWIIRKLLSLTRGSIPDRRVCSRSLKGRSGQVPR